MRSTPIVVLLILTGATACSRAVQKEEPTSTHCRITDVSGAHSWSYTEDDDGGIGTMVPRCIDLLPGKRLLIRRLIGHEALMEEGTFDGKRFALESPSPWGEIQKISINATKATMTVKATPAMVFSPVPSSLDAEATALWTVNYDCIEGHRTDAHCGGCCFDSLMPKDRSDR